MTRYILSLGAVGLLIPAVTTIETQQIDWTPGWPLRLGLGIAGVVMALGALFVDRRTRKP
jgi:hypothetical protein